MLEIIQGAFLLATWLIGIKYPKPITLCNTNTVILVIIVIIIDTYFLTTSEKYKWDY